MQTHIVIRQIIIISTEYRQYAILGLRDFFDCYDKKIFHCAF